MPTFSSILAATDLSRPAREAVLRAARIARDCGAVLHIVHVMQLGALDALRNRLASAPADLQTRVENAARFGLQELAEAVRRDYGLEAALRCVDGELLAEIERARAEAGADLLVFGARGTRGTRHLLLGSTAERLLAHAGCSMLVVRHPAEVTYRSVLVPVDFSADSLPALLRAQALAPQGRIHVLHAYEAPFESRLRVAGLDESQLTGYLRTAAEDASRRLAALVAQAPSSPPVETLLLHGDPLTQVLDQQDELGCQLVVVTQGSGSRVSDRLLGGVSRRVLAQSTGDVLMSI